MATEVKCPNCGFGFPIEEVMVEEYKKGASNKDAGVYPAKRDRTTFAKVTVGGLRR